MPAEFHSPVAGGTVHFDWSFEYRRVAKDLTGDVALCWLPIPRPPRWRKLYPAIVVSATGRYAPVGILKPPPVNNRDKPPALTRPVGPYPWNGGKYRGMLILAGLLAVGVACSGVLVPLRNTATAGAPYDTEAFYDLTAGSVFQCCALVLPLVAFAFYRIQLSPDVNDPQRNPVGQGQDRPHISLPAHVPPDSYRRSMNNNSPTP